MDVGTAYQSYTNMAQSFQTKENRGSKVDYEQKFEIPYTQEEEKETKSSQMDGALADFLKKLREKGAAKFLADLNKEKIEALVQEYKQKLIDEMGDSPEALKKIAKLVEEFKKQLIEEMKEKMEDEKKSKSMISNAGVPIKTSPLEKLLQL
ncbi:MAG: hypothetical protein PHW89_10665 [Sulfurimonas denitrificans]|nr:hypothetical protein [Sulfurimonas denitrificans]